MGDKTIAIWLEKPRIEREGDFYIAYSDQLQLVGCGHTEDAATLELEAVVRTSLQALNLEGLLVETLEKKGIPYKPIVPQEMSDKRDLRPLLVGV